MVEYHHPVNRSGTVRVDLVPPPLPFCYHTCSEVGEERDEFNPMKLILPEEVREIFFFFFFYIVLLKYMCHIYTICTTIYIGSDPL